MHDDKDDKKFYIDEVFGEEIGQLLKGCYYKLKNNGTYTFHDKDHTEKGRDITVPSEFKFKMDGIDWTLTLNSNADEILKGGWWDGKDPANADGEYQAQAGGTGEEGDTNAASAGGYSA